MQTKNSKKYTIREETLDKCAVLDRIKLFYKLKGNAELARLMNVAPNTVTNWYGRGSFDIDKIYTYCVDIDLHWLLTGEGEMLMSASQKSPHKTDFIYKSDPRDAELIASNRETIETQRKLISSLESRIAELEKSARTTKSPTNTTGLRSVPAADSIYPNQTGVKRE